MEISSPHGEHPDKEVMGSWKQYEVPGIRGAKADKVGRREEAREPCHRSAGVDNLAMEDSLAEPTPSSE